MRRMPWVVRTSLLCLRQCYADNTIHSVYHLPQDSSPSLWRGCIIILCSDPLRHEMFRPLFRHSAPFPLVLGCCRPLVGVDDEISEVVQETPLPLFFLAPTQPAPPTNSPNITYFGSLVFFMRATNPANKIRLLCEVASMLSLPVL